MSISDFGRKLACPPPPASTYGADCDAAMSNPWSPEHPDRVMLLGVAENVLTWDFFQQNVHRFYSIHDQDNRSVPEWASGRPYLKQALAKFISNRVFCSPVKPEELVVVSGSGTVMDMISYSFLDPGDGFIAITPCYNSFPKYFLCRTPNVKLYPADTQCNNFVVTEAILEKALQTAKSEGRTIKFLVMTNPSNPVGNVYSKTELLATLHFCRKHKIHLFCDEIYALSVKPVKSRTKGENTFISFAKLLENDPLQQDVTLLWGFSKDMGMSGFRVSVAFSRNPQLISVFSQLARYAEVASVTQSLITNMISDDAFMDEHVSMLQNRVWTMRQLAHRRLDELNIPYFPGIAGFFCWIDLRAYLKENTFSGEFELYHFIVKNGRLIISPGQNYLCTTPGFFRMIFTCYEEDAMNIVFDRMKSCLQIRKKQLM